MMNAGTATAKKTPTMRAPMKKTKKPRNTANAISSASPINPPSREKAYR